MAQRVGLQAALQIITGAQEHIWLSLSNYKANNNARISKGFKIITGLQSVKIVRVLSTFEGVKAVLQLDPASGVPLLTARENQVLELVAQGLSAKQVAQEIDIAPRTVERHIENVRLKIRARNRTHMVTLAMELGLLHVANDAHAPNMTLFQISK
jgi:LuxR family transcriptional regulator of spore coat protein